MSELRECVHCECSALVVINPGCFSGNRDENANLLPSSGYRVECQGMCHAMTCWWHTEQEAIDRWNARPAESRLREENDKLVEKLKYANRDLRKIAEAQAYRVEEAGFLQERVTELEGEVERLRALIVQAIDADIARQNGLSVSVVNVLNKALAAGKENNV